MVIYSYTNTNFTKEMGRELWNNDRTFFNELGLSPVDFEKGFCDGTFSLRQVKKLLKLFGGFGVKEIVRRDGELVSCEDITLTGVNCKHKIGGKGL